MIDQTISEAIVQPGITDQMTEQPTNSINRLINLPCD